MAGLTPDQLRTRRRVESVIRLMAPALDVLLAVGDRVSRIVERDDPEYYPPRVERGGEGAPKPVDGAPRPPASAAHPPDDPLPAR